MIPWLDWSGGEWYSSSSGSTEQSQGSQWTPLNLQEGSRSMGICVLAGKQAMSISAETISIYSNISIFSSAISNKLSSEYRYIVSIIYCTVEVLVMACKMSALCLCVLNEQLYSSVRWTRRDPVFLQKLLIIFFYLKREALSFPFLTLFITCHKCQGHSSHHIAIKAILEGTICNIKNERMVSALMSTHVLNPVCCVKVLLRQKKVVVLIHLPLHSRAPLHLYGLVVTSLGEGASYGISLLQKMILSCCHLLVTLTPLICRW